jgi:hypothetical protein
VTSNTTKKSLHILVVKSTIHVRAIERSSSDESKTEMRRTQPWVSHVPLLEHLAWEATTGNQKLEGPSTHFAANLAL